MGRIWLRFLLCYLSSLNTCWQLPKNQWTHWTSGPFRSETPDNAKEMHHPETKPLISAIAQRSSGKECTLKVSWCTNPHETWCNCDFQFENNEAFNIVDVSAVSLWFSLLFFLYSFWIHMYICTYHLCGREIQHLHLLEGPSCGQTWQVTWSSRNNQPHPATCFFDFDFGSTPPAL